jgi:iron complex transport system ATP-binding protein
MTVPARECKLEARSVSFSYLRPVVTSLSLELNAGTLTGIIGPNGSGKTTVLRLLDGILHPAAGEVHLTGVGPVHRLPRKEVARHIAMVPQNGGTQHPQTVSQFALQGRSPHLSFLGFETMRDEQIALEALEMTSMLQYRAARVSEISGGEKQRLLLARALAQQPQVLLLDELTANLDVNFQVELLRLVRRITRERNLATLVVSHEINLLSAFSDRIILISEGKILQQGGVAETITAENLKQLFGLDFSVRLMKDGTTEVLPVMSQGYQS